MVCLCQSGKIGGTKCGHVWPEHLLADDLPVRNNEEQVITCYNRLMQSLNCTHGLVADDISIYPPAPSRCDEALFDVPLQCPIKPFASVFLLTTERI